MKKLGLLIILFSMSFSSFAARELLFAATPICPYSCPSSIAKPGFLIELTRAVLKPEDFNVVYHKVSRDNWRQQVKDGFYDGIIGISHLEKGNLIIPESKLPSLHYQFFTLANNSWQYNKFIDLDKTRVGIIQGLKYGVDMEAYIMANRNSKKLTLVTSQQGLKQLTKLMQKNKIGALLEDQVIFNHYLTSRDMNQAQYRPAGDFSQQSLHVAFFPKHPKAKLYAKLFDDHFLSFQKSKAWSELLEKYGLSLELE